MAYIYVIDRQVIDGVAVRRNIAKDTSLVRVQLNAFALECALGLRYEFDPRSGIAILFDPRVHSRSFFGLFYWG